MTNLEISFTVLILAGGTFLTRVTPFLLFPDNKEIPPFVVFLGRALPGALIGMLIVYCLKDVSFLETPHGLPEAISLLFILLLHLWRKNTLLSIGLGTLLYMLLVQVVFVP